MDSFYGLVRRGVELWAGTHTELWFALHMVTTFPVQPSREHLCSPDAGYLVLPADTQTFIYTS